MHCEPRIPWQPKRAAYFAEGFRKIGIPCKITDSRLRTGEGFPILLGTSCWRGIESDGGQYLLVDRCSFGDTEKFVSLVWNGHGRRGDHKVPENFNGERWERYGVELKPVVQGWAERIVLCGQTETYSPYFASPEDWYKFLDPWPTHFRAHPAGANPTKLPAAGEFQPHDIAVTLNSSIGVQCILNGITTVTMDEGAMAYDVSGHCPSEATVEERQPWCNWLAWTQWCDDEIREGTPWRYLLS